MSRPRFSNLRESALATLIDVIHKEKNIPKDIVINIIEKDAQYFLPFLQGSCRRWHYSHSQGRYHD